jgi:hypothetical protein
MRHSEFRHGLAFAALVLAIGCSSRPTQVSHSGKGAFETALAPLGDGFAVAWYDTRDGNGEIYMRLLDADGRLAGPERRLTTGPEDSLEASIESFQGHLVVAWYDQSGQGQQTAKLGMWTRDGTNRWVHVFAGGTRNPVIRISASAIFCAWIQMEADGREAVFAGWWDGSGKPQSAPTRLGPASKTTWNLNAAIDEMGVGWVVFDAEVETRASEVYIARADGSATKMFQLTKDDVAPSKYPDLSIGAAGRAALSWQDERDGNVEVYLFTGPLADLTGEIDERSRRVTNTPGESDGAYLSWNGDRLGLAWSDKTSGQHEVYFTSFDANGSMRKPERRITQTSTWSLAPAIRPDGTGFVLAWTEYVPASVAVHQGTAEVYFQKIP